MLKFVCLFVCLFVFVFLFKFLICLLFTVERMKPNKHRNASDFPEGDRDPARDRERRDATHYREFVGNVNIPIIFVCV
jgi:hypothetical protein